MRIVQGFSWSLVPGVQVMLVDNVNANDLDCSGLPSNLYMVEWREGRGETETTDAPGLRTTFTDISPYAPYFQRFMTVKSTDGSVFSLTQAKKIQTDLITCLFDDKRQAPITYSVAAQANAVWSANDTDVAAMSLQMVGGTGSSVSTSLVSQINAMIDAINSRIVAVANANAGQFNVMNANVTYAMPLLASTSFVLVGGGNINPKGASPGTDGRGPGSGNFGNMTTIAHIGGPASGAMPWSPIGATAPLNLSSDELTGLMAQIAARRQGLLNTRNSKTAAVAALTTIPAVIAYSVTAGW